MAINAELAKQLQAETDLLVKTALSKAKMLAETHVARAYQVEAVPDIAADILDSQAEVLEDESLYGNIGRKSVLLHIAATNLREKARDGD